MILRQELFPFLFLTAGNYTWAVEHFPFNGENSSSKFYADVYEGEYLTVTCFMRNEEDEEIKEFLSSIHMAEGDPSKLKSDWLDSRRK